MKLPIFFFFLLAVLTNIFAFATASPIEANIDTNNHPTTPACDECKALVVNCIAV
ncbi:hypothetical protein EJ08DRAFT_649683 [Tothia fuscella]|uniref:Uncharacterized protein n=1 Tax=Tothia fuscella TaxID=1048955 RepID=A0A9P4TYJ6_9PEZI|nr:hypothetical protein EJ08DRAFT_649683 [Tothia fuscella]